MAGIVTIYRHFNPRSDKYLIDVETALERIQSGRSRATVERIRQTGDGELKKQLPCVLFSGEFSYRNRASLVAHSGFICLDFDKFKDSGEVEGFRDSINDDPYTYSAWISPSGKGVKVLVKIPAEVELHKARFDSLRDYYGSDHFDIACSDVCRICFESYDPDICFNPDSQVWTRIAERPVAVDPTGPSTLDVSETVRRLLLWSSRKYPITDGQRNANMFKVAASFNDFGVARSEAEAVLSQFAQEGFEVREIERIINNAYKDAGKFGRYRW